MSLEIKIQRNRTLKRTAAEFRHLLSRLTYNCSLAHSSANRGHGSTLEAANATARQETILHTRCCGTTARQRYESCVGFDLHARVKLRCPVCAAERKEASELSAMTEALCILPSDTEWRRLLTAFDSDVSVEFDRLLSCCDAAAVVEVSAQETTELASMRDRQAADRPPAGRRYKATVSVAMPGMEEEESGVLLVGEGHAAGLPGTLKWPGRVPDAPVKEENSAFFPAKYDFGAGSDWSASPRDAVKAALAEATSVLREAAAGELRAAGREGALLLNELRAGGSCTDDFDALYLSSVLAKDTDRTLISSDACSSSFSCPSVALRWHVRVHLPEPESGSAAARTDSNSNVTSQGDGERGAATAAAAVDGVALVKVSGVEKTVVSIERVPCERVREHISIAIAAPLLSASVRPSGSAKSSRRDCRDAEAEELRSLLPGSVLLYLACQRCSLYRRTRCWTHESCTSTASRSGEGSIVTTDSAAREASLPVSWSALSRLSAVSPTGQSSLAKRVGSPSNTGESNVGTMVLRAHNALQNVWHCPDVVVMLAELRLLLRLPHTSFPTIAFSQTAVHDPARRTRELANGCYGDVDVLTRVQITWSTPRGTFTALAESDPAKHAGRPADPADGVRWLACEDTGSPRGPLPLLLAAVCSLYRTVKGIGSASLQHYPLIPLQNPRSRSSLDFLLYSWFAASPQIRCFAISTTRPGTAAAAAMMVDGVSQVALGATMTRAMLFYDLLGQRVLFAETHAADLESAVARLEVLAVERNQIPHDAYVPVSAARERSYRDIGRLRRWQDASRAAAAATGSGGPPPLQYRLLRQCARTSGSELCALWTVVEVMSHWLRPSTATAVSCADAEEKNRSRGSVVGHDCLSVRFLPDAPLRERDSDEEESLQRAWASGVHGSWSARPLGTEAPPPPSGLVELWWSPPTVQAVAAAEGEAVAVEGGGAYRPACFRCQVDPLLSESTSRRAARGILPALTLLCREALHHVYGCLCQLHGEGSGSGAAAQRLPPLDELLAWCAEADPVLVRRSDGFPPYDARFYAAPALLGEVLQGVAGKYACAYRALPQRTQAAGASHAYGSEWAATSAGGYAGSPSSPPQQQQQQQQPSTVFYTSAALNVDPSVEADADDGGPWAASRRRTEAQSAPPSVQCTLFIDSIVGRKVRCEHRAPAEVPNAFSLPPDTASGEEELATRVVLGHGVGRTKREAWSSAAWQALRLQFSEVLTQVEALRDVAEATRQPYQLNLLLAPAPVPQTDSSSTGDSPPRSPAFRLEWAWRRAPSVWTTKVGGSSSLHDTGAMVERAPGVVCTARLVCADGTHVSLPQTAAAGCSAAEAYVRCARGVLRQISEARRAAQGTLRGTGTARDGPTVWSSWSSAAQLPTAPLVSAEARRGAPLYAQWRLTTHYAKSVWHAYAGALSLHVERDLVVLLVHVMEGHTAAFGSSSSGGGSERDRWRGEASHALVVHQLSVLQVRERGDVRQRGGPQQQQQQRYVGSGFSDSPLRGDGFHSRSPFPLGVSAVAGASCTAPSGTFVFSHSPASLVARHASSPPSPTLSPTPSDVPHASTGFALLREASGWLRELTQECALPLQARVELQGLVCGRLSELRSMQRASRWSAGERVEALLRRWTGCPARVRLHRRTAASQSRRGEEEGGGGGGNEWVAQALLQVTVERHHVCVEERGGLYGSHNNSREGDRWEGIDGEGGGGGDEAAHCGVVSVTERGWWVVGSAAAATSEDAVWTLFREACAAVDEVEAVLLAEKPPMAKQRKEG